MHTVILATLAVMTAPQNTSFDSPEWRSRIAKGYVPYHQLRVEDFQTVDRAPSEDLIYTTGFIDYAVRTTVVSRRPVVVGVAKITIWSGLDRKQTWRRSSLSDPARYLDHEQGHLDINELYARSFAKVTELPQGSGADISSAMADLSGKMTRLFNEFASANRREQDRYDQETRGGDSRVKQQEWRASLNARLTAAGVTVVWRGF